MSRALAVMLASLAIFAALAVRVTEAELPWLDSRLLRLVPPGNDPNQLSDVFHAFVLAGIAFGLVFVTIAFVGLVVRRWWREAFFWGSTFLGVAALEVALKALFERPPIGDASDGYSFPSGNAMASMALLVAARTLVQGGELRRFLSFGGGALVFVYGVALVYLSWHYPTDVVAGWLLSLAWVSFLGLTVRPRDVIDAARPRSARSLSTQALRD